MSATPAKPTPVQFFSAFPSTSPSNLITWGIFVSSTFIFAILLLIVFSASPEKLYFDYHNSPENNNPIYSEVYHHLIALEKNSDDGGANAKIRMPFSVGRYLCEKDNIIKDNTNSHQELSSSSSSSVATFDDSGVSFGFVASDYTHSSTSKTTQHHQNSISEIRAEFSSTTVVDKTVMNRTWHQPHQFVAHVIGFSSSMSDLPMQPELPFGWNNSKIVQDKIVYYKETRFTTEDFVASIDNHGSVFIKLYDHHHPQQHDSSSTVLINKKHHHRPRVFLVWVIKITEPNFNRRDHSIGNEVRFKGFQLIFSSSSKTRQQQSTEFISICDIQNHQQEQQQQRIHHQQFHHNNIINNNKNKRRIQFIGDSITAGFCNIPRGQTPINDTNEPKRSSYLDEDFTRSWPFLISEKLGARFHSTSWSGIGLVRNTRGAGENDESLKDIYKRTLTSNGKSEVWDMQKFIPDVLFVNLGTNDFQKRNPKEDLRPVASEEELAENFVDEYFKLVEYYYDAFLLKVHEDQEKLSTQNEKRPSRFHIVLACGPMNTDICDRILQKKLIDGDNRQKQKIAGRFPLAEVSLLKFPALPSEMTECGTHPNAEGDVRMSEIGTAHLRKVMKWM